MRKRGSGGGLAIVGGEWREQNHERLPSGWWRSYSRSFCKAECPDPQPHESSVLGSEKISYLGRMVADRAMIAPWNR